jgi:hypothetical protein
VNFLTQSFQDADGLFVKIIGFLNVADITTSGMVITFL